MKINKIEQFPQDIKDTLDNLSEQLGKHYPNTKIVVSIKTGISYKKIMKAIILVTGIALMFLGITDRILNGQDYLFWYGCLMMGIGVLHES